MAIVSRPDGDVPERAREEGLAFIALPLKYELDLSSARRLAKIFDDRAVDVVHAHKGIAHSVALFATYFARRRPVIVVNRGVSFPLDWLVKQEDASPLLWGVGGRRVSLRLGDRTD